MSLPAIQNLVNNGLSNHHLIIVVILILKHATTLRFSNMPKEALTLAELDYQKANIDLKIQEHLKAVTPEDSVDKVADFIMATNIAKIATYRKPLV